MSPIANIDIAIAIPIFRHFKMTGDPDLDRSFAIADLFNDLFNIGHIGIVYTYRIFLVKSKDSYFLHYIMGRYFLQSKKDI